MARSPGQEDNEHRIAKAIRRKDFRRAIELMAEAHGSTVGRLCFAMAGSQTEAEELVQEILIAAYRALPSFEGRSSVRTWIYTIARRTCSRALQRRRRRDLLVAQAMADELALVPPTADPQQLMESSQKHHQLQQAVATLPPSQREVLLLRYVGGLRFREVGQVCSISEEAARQRASAGLRRLRRVLAPARTEDFEQPVGLALRQEASQ